MRVLLLIVHDLQSTNDVSVPELASIRVPRQDGDFLDPEFAEFLQVPLRGHTRAVDLETVGKPVYEM